MQEEVDKALAAKNDANTKMDWIKTFTRGSDTLSASAKINANTKSQKAASKDLELDLKKNIQPL